jgi:hypothetical protein
VTPVVFYWLRERELLTDEPSQATHEEEEAQT